MLEPDDLGRHLNACAAVVREHRIAPAILDLVSRGNGYPSTQLIVTATDPLADVGTDPGQVPPVGSVISNFKIAGFGLSYSAMPSPSGDVVKVKLLTPLFDIPCR